MGANPKRRFDSDSMVVSDPIAGAWFDIPDSIRRHISSFLSGARRRRAIAVATQDYLPRVFADDLMGGGVRLRAAFPDLRRRLTAITSGAGLTIEVHCEGTHDCAFFEILSPSKRVVRFAERHTFDQCRQGGLLGLVDINLGEIVRQLSGSRPTNDAMPARAICESGNHGG